MVTGANALTGTMRVGLAFALLHVSVICCWPQIFKLEENELHRRQLGSREYAFSGRLPKLARQALHYLLPASKCTARWRR
jgi:hypothetical protein